MKKFTRKDIVKKILGYISYVGRKILFFKAEHRKYLSPLELWYCKKRSQDISFSIVTAVYNTGKYLDDYFKSITRQTLDFKKHIHIIMVDDGSEDNSASIIEKWQKKYPKNITYLYQENQGASVARNKGLSLVKGQWTTFIDSDDFVHPNYFHHVAKAIVAHWVFEPKLITCRQIKYYEASGKFKDDRPFRPFYENPYALYSTKEWGNAMEMSTSSVFFLSSELERQGALFPENWTLSEDFYFLMKYLANCTEGHCVFCRYPRYYYRRRASRDSQTDLGSIDVHAYTTILRDGNLALLKLYKAKFGKIPKHLQRMILYTMSWRIKWVYPDGKNASILSLDERTEFLELCKEIFSYIDIDLIMKFPPALGGYSLPKKIGSLYCFKGIAYVSDVMYVMKVDFKKKLVKLIYHSTDKDNSCCVFYINGKAVYPSDVKLVTTKFLDETFLHEFIFWVPIKERQTLTSEAHGVRVKFIMNSRTHESLSYLQLMNYVSLKYKSPVSQSDTHWIFIDRDINADDSAEFLYRYVAKNFPSRKLFFALRKNASSWKRLQDEGFKLLDYGSDEYRNMLKTSTKVISSQLGDFIFLKDEGLRNSKQFVFLQHGVIKDDISLILNNKKIDLMITSSPMEHESIVADGSPYRLGHNEVALAGLPRFDQLLARAQSTPPSSCNVLLIMPTWRSSLASPIRGTTEYSLASDFWESAYAKAWFGLIQSPQFLSLVQKYNYTVQFFPHHCMQDCLRDLPIYSKIQFIRQNDISDFQKYILDATILLTDYSSVAFNMAFLRKPVLYFQFDENDISESFQYKKGYFDYRLDGFGPVVTDESALLEQLDVLFRAGLSCNPKFLERMERALPVRDGKNCERIYEAILEMDEPELQTFLGR